ncbi:hypothetical protein SeLEV6574_g00817 [Synchytrium endobioticum]|uniref:F-box domain-containing protein n=1 Tax=Synchytrium endobioticum TaxID=286115 RepID=A0A507DFY4_9FUNG|nr:hypothetical protein SeLEV6574_g00817 [Synchytrium endobioticum]
MRTRAQHTPTYPTIDQRQPRMKLLDLPEELLFLILMSVEDFDLQKLRNTCPRLLSLASDVVLLRHFLQRNSQRVSSRLFDRPQRPNREELVAKNIMRGPSSRAMVTALREGRYLGSPRFRAVYEAQRGMERWAKAKSLLKGLSSRPAIESLSERNVIPREALNRFVFCGAITSPPRRVKQGLSPSLVPRAMKLCKAFTRNTVNHLLAKRMDPEKFSKSDVNKLQRITAVPLSAQYAAQALNLHFHLTSQRVLSSLIARPKVEELDAIKILKNDANTALLLCPAVRPKIASYNRMFFESRNLCPLGSSTAKSQTREVFDHAFHVFNTGGSP